MSTKVTASFTLRAHQFTGVPVVNPGDWFGKSWLIVIGEGPGCNFYVVEADSPSDAIDEFIDSEYGSVVHIEGSELGDYGSKVSPGDIIGGVTIEKEGWMNLRGELVTDPAIWKRLQEPHYGGNGGTPTDIEHLHIHGEEGKATPFQCLYHGEGIPEGGVSPLQYYELLNLSDEHRAYIAKFGDLSKRNLSIGLIVEIYEAGREVGDAEGSERTRQFIKKEYGDPLAMLTAIREIYYWVGDETFPEHYRDRKTQLWPFVQNAGTFRAPTCHVEWRWEGQAKVPVFTWHDAAGRHESLTIADTPVEKHFTFERLLEEETK